MENLQSGICLKARCFPASLAPLLGLAGISLPGRAYFIHDFQAIALLALKRNYPAKGPLAVKEHYHFKEIELKWQEHWEREGLFKSKLDPDAGKGSKFYGLVMFPYPSGALHMGHVINYTLGDVLARYHLGKQKEILHPMGWDAFGLPAENAAIKAGVHPAIWTKDNIDTMRRQMKRMGWAYDWDREISTHHPGYYQWTQWLFLQMFERGLAYRKEAFVNWDPVDQTVLANEQVIDGRSYRSGALVEKRRIEQWFLKITDYAERLLEGLDRLDQWPDRVKAQQREWIGRSTGAEIEFVVEATGEKLPVYTTRPDTIFGVTFMSLAPEHPLVEQLVQGTEFETSVMKAVRAMRNQSAVERTSAETEKVGVWTGQHVINPVNGRRVQLWVANYALMDYGTGAVMAVPAHDSRDFAFARKYNLPIELVIQPTDAVLRVEDMPDAFVDDGIMVHSGPFNGRPNREAMDDIVRWFEEKGFGGPRVNYRMRDWLISRQRYWGAPIPIIYDEDNRPHPVPYEDLPVVHPRDVKFSGRGGNPLASNADFIQTTVPGTHRPGRRETDTMDTFVDSSWYFLRYVSPRDTNQPFDPAVANLALPVDTYIGGIEHAILHLLYSRFFTKVIHDLGLISFDEPFEKLFCQGMVCRNAYHADYYRLKSDPAAPPTRPDQVQSLDDTIVRVSDGQEVVREQVWLPEEQIDQEKMQRISDGWPVVGEMAKMSKSKLNGISPDLVVDTYGADALHAYILFMGPADKDMVYEESGLVGIYRFLNRLWANMQLWVPVAKDASDTVPAPDQLSDADKAIRAKTHEAIRRVTEIMENSFNYNVAVSQLMELHNTLRDQFEHAQPAVVRESVKHLVRMMALFTPHLGEELWAELGLPFSVFRAEWPAFDASALVADTMEVVVQINGKLRDRISVSADLQAEDLQREILASPRISNQLEGKTIIKVIQADTRQGKLLNIVIR